MATSNENHKTQPQSISFKPTTLGRLRVAALELTVKHGKHISMSAIVERSVDQFLTREKLGSASKGGSK